MTPVPWAVGRARQALPGPRLLDFDLTDTLATGPCPACRLPVALLGDQRSDEAVHVSYGRPPSAVLCCPFCGGLARRGFATGPRLSA